MKKTLIVVGLFAACLVDAQVVLLWDSRFEKQPNETRIQLIDLGVTNTKLNPNYEPWLRAYPSRSIVDLQTKQNTEYTGDIDADLKELERRYYEKRPGKKQLKEKLHGRTKKEAVAYGIDAIKNASSWNQGQQALVEYLETLSTMILEEMTDRQLGILDPDDN